MLDASSGCQHALRRAAPAAVEPSTLDGIVSDTLKQPRHAGEAARNSGNCAWEQSSSAPRQLSLACCYSAKTSWELHVCHSMCTLHKD